MTKEIEWVRIPLPPNYEVNRNGEVRNQDKAIQSWGQTYFLYGGEHSRMRVSMFAAMRKAFGDECVDKSNAIRKPKNA
jgi:hypothetical protein